MSRLRPVCFVLTPFGVKIHPDSGVSVDFDAIYEGTLRPAVDGAGMDSVRVDQEIAGLSGPGVRERVLVADFVLADVTTRDPAILFLLGARMERMPGATLVIGSRGSETQIMSLAAIRVVTYELDEGNRLSSRESLRLRKTLSAVLSEMCASLPPSGGQAEPSPDVQERSMRGAAIARAIDAARDKRDVKLLQSLEAEVGQMDQNSALLLNVFQAYASLGKAEALLDLFPRLPQELQSLPRVRQQTGLALNRIGRGDEAVAMLTGLLQEQGADSETFGILGRVYKDIWFKSKDPSVLDRAIECYVKGFESNRKDAYPGINAVTLLELRGDPDSQKAKANLLPLVMAAVQDQIKFSRRPNYWDYATLLELAVLAADESQARLFLASARGCNPDDWQTETTANNLSLIRDARAQRGEQQPWLDKILAELRTPVAA